MNGLILGNAAYRKLDGICGGHITSEGAELQDGLIEAGWAFAGRHSDDYAAKYFQGKPVECLNETRVDRILAWFKPDAVFIQDPRDMQRENGGCFDKWTNFENIDALTDFTGVKVLVFKDAGPGPGSEYQKQFAARIKPDALACYYHDDSILKLSPWAKQYKRIRMYHSVDDALIATLNLKRHRSRGVVTGAHDNWLVYPLRHTIFQRARLLRINQLKHPGYNGGGCMTPEYLVTLTDYKVHLATASAYGFALRKIIESVCCGCIPITDLPTYDKLPVIDDWLVRISSYIDMQELMTVIDHCEDSWEQGSAISRAQAATAFYNYRAAGKRLDSAITELVNARN